MNLPGHLNVALAQWLADHATGGLAQASAALSEAYRAGETSSAVSLAAYLTTRVPATFAANLRVLESVAEAWPGLAPQSLLDVGAGPGVASWAALAQWPSLTSATQVEQEPKFLALARALNAGSGLPALANADVVQGQLQQLDKRVDLVLASYVLAELPLAQMVDAAGRLWAAAGQALVLVEPGTPQGFARLRAIRDHLLKDGAHVVAPCTHAHVCPMVGDDWCHFKVRLARSRAHMHAKGAVVPFEDEAFSYLALARQSVALAGSRIIAPPAVAKPGITFRLCQAEGLGDHHIARRDKAQYKLAKSKRWGDTWT